MYATTGRPEAAAKPDPDEMEDPMQNRKSAMLKGGSSPRV